MENDLLTCVYDFVLVCLFHPMKDRDLRGGIDMSMFEHVEKENPCYSSRASSVVVNDRAMHRRSSSADTVSYSSTGYPTDLTSSPLVPSEGACKPTPVYSGHQQQQISGTSTEGARRPVSSSSTLSFVPSADSRLLYENMASLEGMTLQYDLSDMIEDSPFDIGVSV
eukprot:m.168609 g.168609  ORF g.168609 m.168609 type:complete len:167 (+) comp14480_c1_seq1:175-675(+)